MDTKNTARNKTTESQFHDFFVDQIKDIYWAEKHITDGLKKMSKAATNKYLVKAFDKHLNESCKQIEVLEQVFEALGEKPQAKRCAAMAGLLEETDSMIEDTEKDSFVRDAGLILAAQKIEHYEIATYGTLRVLASYLPEKGVAKLLSSILKGEKATDEALTKIAEEYINACAAVE